MIVTENWILKGIPEAFEVNQHDSIQARTDSLGITSFI